MIYQRSFLGMSLNRRMNRRRIVAGWWLAVALLFVLAALFQKTQRGLPHSVLLNFVYFFAFLAINSLGRFVWVPRPDPKKFSAGIRTLFDTALHREMKKNPASDEREERRWDKVSRRAYEIVVLAFLLLLGLHYYGLMPRSRGTRELLLWFVFFAVLQLPNAIFLWTEPDLEEQP
jgi:hypothetical protein